jgi:hypothetical protein
MERYINRDSDGHVAYEELRVLQLLDRDGAEMSIKGEDEPYWKMIRRPDGWMVNEADFDEFLEENEIRNLMQVNMKRTIIISPSIYVPWLFSLMRRSMLQVLISLAMKVFPKSFGIMQERSSFHQNKFKGGAVDADTDTIINNSTVSNQLSTRAMMLV